MYKPKNKLVYLAGPYRGEIDFNILKAQQAACKLWEMGYWVICPHLNTARFEEFCRVHVDVYLEAYLEVVSRCDLVVLLPGWEKSEGSVAEKAVAEANRIPVVEYVDIITI